MDADSKRPACSQLGNKTFCFCGVCSGQHTLRTGLVKPPRSQLGVERILRLTKVKRSFQSTQDAGGGPRSACGRDAQGHMGSPGAASARTRGALKVGPKPRADGGSPGSVPLLGAERPPQPHQRTGQQDCGAPRPAQPRSRSSTSAPPISREAGSQVFKWKIKTGENNQEASVNNN